MRRMAAAANPPPGGPRWPRWPCGGGDAVETVRLAGPFALVTLLQFAQATLAVAAVGRACSRAELAAAVLGGSIFNATGVAVAVGLASAMEGLCASALGAGDETRCWLVLGRALLLQAAVAVPLGTLWLGAGQVLPLLGQGREVSRLTATYLAALAPALFAMGGCECLKRYLLSRRELAPVVWACGLPTAASPLLLGALVGGPPGGLGLVGAGLAMSALYGAQLALLAAATWRGAGRLPRWTLAAVLEGWRGHAAVALPACAMVCVEWWTWEIVMFLSGMLPHPERSVAASGIAFQVVMLLYAVPNGTMGAVAVRVAGHLGEGDVAAARSAALSSVALTGVLALALAGGMLALAPAWVQAFAPRDPSVQAEVRRLVPLLALAVLFDHHTACFSGIVRGAGTVISHAAAVNLVAHYGLGLPLAAALGFWAGRGTPGLWTGLVLSCAAASAGMGVLAFHGWPACDVAGGDVAGGDGEGGDGEGGDGEGGDGEGGSGESAFLLPR